MRLLVVLTMKGGETCGNLVHGVWNEVCRKVGMLFVDYGLWCQEVGGFFLKKAKKHIYNKV